MPSSPSASQPVFEPALCVRHWDWSETSQVVSLFTRTRGVLRVLAKGSKRPGTPYSGGVESLTLGDAGIIIKSASDLCILTEWDLRDPMLHLRSSLTAFNAAHYIADTIGHLIIDADPHPALFDRTLDALRALASPSRAVFAVLARFQWAALVEAGYKPELRIDLKTRQPLSASAPLAFDPALGALTDAMTPGTWRLSPGTLDVLRRLESQEPDKRRAPLQSVERASRFLAAYTGWLVGRPLPTASLVFADHITGAANVREILTGETKGVHR
ncbi:MAG: DNA repair protein RecO [Phycisphaerales bacterium]|nr:DNA repair protein RecO [Phycisphaerales bacterium]